MAGGRFVESGSHDLGLDRAFHVGDLLGTLVDEEHHEVGVGIVLGNGIGNLLHQDGLTGFGLGHDECALAFSDGRKEVDHAAGKRCLSAGGKFELLVGEEWGEMLKSGAIAQLFRGESVDAFDTE